MMRKLSLVLLALLALSCQPPPPEMEIAPERTAAEVDSDFDALRAEWQSMANTGDASGIAALYAEDAAFADPYGNVHTGRAAIQSYLEEMFVSATDFIIETTDIVFQGDMVAGYGAFSETVQRPEGAVNLSGLWQTVSMYQPDGSILILMHQSMLPAEPPEM
jgi:uncharacterized protein (TIGR02246 family)